MDLETEIPDPAIEQKLDQMSIESPQGQDNCTQEEGASKDFSLLFSLPPELRSCIYSQLLPTGEVLEYDHTWFYNIRIEDDIAVIRSHSTEDAPLLANLESLSSICHLMRSEVLDHYYSLNTFVLAENVHLPRLKNWLERMPVDGVRHLKRVVVEHWKVCELESGNEECLRRLLVNLESLEIKSVRDAGGHEGNWSCDGCAVAAETWAAEVRSDAVFGELKKGWDFETIGAGDLERLMKVVKAVGDS